MLKEKDSGAGRNLTRRTNLSLTTSVSPNVGIISESAKIQYITTLEHSGIKVLL